TISNYLAVLEATFIAHVIRPYSSHRPTEIISAPKVYGFDTGFVCYHRGWHELRRDDLGLLWEHLVLNEMHAHLQSREIRYWRDKRGHEVDFILAHTKQPSLAIECKWSAAVFDSAHLQQSRLHRRFQPGSHQTFPVGDRIQVLGVGFRPRQPAGIPATLPTGRQSGGG